MTDAIPTQWPPTQHLLLDLLAARARLDETCWTVPNRCRPAIGALAGHGLVEFKSATIPGHTLVWLTAAGRDAAMMTDYVPPSERTLWVVDDGETLHGPFTEHYDADWAAVRAGGTVRPVRRPTVE